MKVFCSWSGGKDCCLALYRAITDGIEVEYLLNMVSHNDRLSRSHGLRAQLLIAQSEAIGISLFQQRASRENYETEFKKAVLQMKEDGIEGGVFGDMALEEHRGWIERVCRDLSIKPIFPLWKADREELLRHFVSSGFEAIVVAIRKGYMGAQWLGRKIDDSFIADLKREGDVDLCGELGEYHSFVTDGPIFSKRIEILESRRIERGETLFLEIEEYKLEDK